MSEVADSETTKPTKSRSVETSSAWNPPGPLSTISSVTGTFDFSTDAPFSARHFSVPSQVPVRLSTAGQGGIVFDQYGERDFKYVVLDLQAGAVVIGHRIRNQWVDDARFATPLVAGVDYRVVLVLNGTAVAVTLNGVQVGSFSYNGAVADGGLGAISRTGTTAFDDVRVAIGARVSSSPDNQPPVLTAAVGIGLFLPPIGVGLLMALRFGNISAGRHFRAYWPYLAALVIGLLILILVPEITLFLPRRAGLVR